MCSERGLGSACRERSVHRPETCCCPVPQSVEVIIKRIQILSFEPSTGGGPNATKRFPLHDSFPNEDRQAA